MDYSSTYYITLLLLICIVLAILIFTLSSGVKKTETIECEAIEKECPSTPTTESESTPSTPQSTPAIEESKITVLVVDDMEESRNIIKNILIEENCEVVTATGAIDGLIYLQTGEFDTAFISINLKGMNGIQCAESFREWQNTYNICNSPTSPSFKPIKATLLIGVLESVHSQCCSESIDVFVPYPLNRPTVRALLFSAADFSYQNDFEIEYDIKIKDQKVNLLSCFSTACTQSVE